MEKVDYDFLKRNNLIIYEIITGSNAYGLARPGADRDCRFVYILPDEYLFGLRKDYVEKVTVGEPDENGNVKEDHYGYELSKFFEMLLKVNPNTIEFLHIKPEFILHKDPIMDFILDNKDMFLSKEAKDSFVRYADDQLKQARSKNKLVVNEKEYSTFKTPLDFCYIIDRERALSIGPWLKKHNMDQKFIGLSKVPHAREEYAAYYDWTAHNCFYEGIPFEVREKNKEEVRSYGGTFGYGFKGLVVDEDEENSSNTIRISSIPKEAKEDYIFNMIYSQDAYTHYKKEYKRVKIWKKERNPLRHLANTQYGHLGYDVKNASHTIRLLKMGVEILEGKGVNVFRDHDRDEILAVKDGKYSYEDLLAWGAKLKENIDQIYYKSTLQEQVNKQKVLDLLYKIRIEFRNRS